MDRFEWMPDRRRAMRVDLLAELQGQLIALDEDVRVRQLGPGGMSIETSVPLSPREVQEFRLTIDDRTMRLHGRITHSRVAIENDEVTYHSGVAFVDLDPADLAAIEAFLADQRPAD